MSGPRVGGWGLTRLPFWAGTSGERAVGGRGTQDGVGTKLGQGQRSRGRGWSWRGRKHYDDRSLIRVQAKAAALPSPRSQPWRPPLNNGQPCSGHGSVEAVHSMRSWMCCGREAMCPPLTRSRPGGVSRWASHRPCAGGTLVSSYPREETPHDLKPSAPPVPVDARSAAVKYSRSCRTNDFAA